MRALLTLSLALAACIAGAPRPLPPMRFVDEAAREPIAAAAESSTMTLAEAFRFALARSDTVSVAARAVAEADIHRRETWTELEPNVSARSSAIVQREVIFQSPMGPIALTPGKEGTAGVALDQPLFRPDHSASRTAGVAGADSADANYKRARQQLARDVAQQFIDVMRTRRLVELAADAVDRATTQQQLAAARVKAGQALRNAELLADVDLTRAQRLQVTAQRDAAVAELGFQRVVGRAAPHALEMPAIPDVPEVKVGLELAMKRPDLGALNLRLEQAQAEQQAASNRRWWPSLDFNANIQVQTPKYFNDIWTGAALLLVTIPLFQSGHEFVDVALHENATHVAELQLEEQHKIVAEEVQVAALQMSITARTTELANKEREAARENYKLVDKQVRLGAITSLEVTNAQAVLTEAESAFEVATMDRALAIYEYLFAIGTLDLESPTATIKH
jgi:outer membrane protein